jgi:hypothetical protein
VGGGEVIGARAGGITNPEKKKRRLKEPALSEEKE